MINIIESVKEAYDKSNESMNKLDKIFRAGSVIDGWIYTITEIEHIFMKINIEGRAFVDFA